MRETGRLLLKLLGLLICCRTREICEQFFSVVVGVSRKFSLKKLSAKKNLVEGIRGGLIGRGLHKEQAMYGWVFAAVHRRQ